MPSFDVVSRTELVDVDNAVQGAMREISTRYDFKGTDCSIEHSDSIITILAEDDFKLKQMQELLKGHMGKRKVDISAFDWGKPEDASGTSLRQTVTIRQGIERDVTQVVIKAIKGSKLKLQVSIQGDQLRVSGKKRDDLQSGINLIKSLEIDLPLQYTNFRD